MSFLPDDYQAPKASNYYLKLVEGENKIRVMSKPIFGWIDWKDNKPMRFRMDQKPLKAVDPKKAIRHFWAFVVFNYNNEQIQIFEVTQASIRKSLEALCRDKDWGSPYGYDLKIMKTGEGVNTEYAINPIPHKPTDSYLVSCFNERPCNLNALFTNEDPFSPEWTVNHLTKLADVADELEPVKKEVVEAPKKDKILPFKDEKITQEQVKKLTGLFSEMPDTFVDQVHEFMKKQNIASYQEMTTATYERVMKQALVEKAKQTVVEGKIE